MFWSDFGWLNVNVITISANVISFMVLGVHRFFSSNTSRWSSVTYGSGSVSGSNFDTISAIFNTIFILHNVRPWIILIDYLPELPVFIFFLTEEYRLSFF